jgi:hypothetical protein
MKSVNRDQIDRAPDRWLSSPDGYATWSDGPIVRRRRLLFWNSCARLLTALSLLTTIANAAAAGKSNLAPGSHAREANKPSIGIRVTTGNPLWTVSVEGLAATRDRPLFSRTRRPPAPPVANVPPPRPELPVKPEQPPLVLIGTIIGGSEVIAVFRDQTAKRVIDLHSGESRYGWLLDRVQERNVVLEKGNSNAFLALSADTSAPVMVAIQQPAPEFVRRQRQ